MIRNEKFQHDDDDENDDKQWPHDKNDGNNQIVQIRMK